ncbi:uncharacterized protein GWK60_H03861 [Nakaseomyces glabratus]|nr:hypothetical protein J6894_02227 [Nakaseomyces glabratus]QNG14307.1 uncharacterized protein GWK60_H03861 [Nakaseomyces glabratus]
MYKPFPVIIPFFSAPYFIVLPVASQYPFPHDEFEISAIPSEGCFEDSDGWELVKGLVLFFFRIPVVSSLFCRKGFPPPPPIRSRCSIASNSTNAVPEIEDHSLEISRRKIERCSGSSIDLNRSAHKKQPQRKFQEGIVTVNIRSARFF